MSELYLDCSLGISGDMVTASLLDCGADKNVLQAVLDSVPLKEFKIEITDKLNNGIKVLDFNVILDNPNHDHDMKVLFSSENHENMHSVDHKGHHIEHKHRHLTDIMEILDNTKMTDGSRNIAVRIFEILAESEAKAHGIPKEEVHFHEVGAVDSIVDIISMAVCYDNLGVTKAFVGNLTEGTGTVNCAHGVLNIPVPAVANILKDYHIPFSIKNEHCELITPTGAAFLAAINPIYETPVDIVIKSIGRGSGKREYRTKSVLVSYLFEETAEHNDTIVKLETNIDDCSGEQMGFVQEILLENGALDVVFHPCYMKKNRPAVELSVVCDFDKVSRMEELIFCHTTTIGIRKVVMKRTKLDRQEIMVETPYGNIKAKKVYLNGKQRIYPEYESIRKICKENGLDYYEVIKAVK